MLLVPCPDCGPRPESEFQCLGEATAPRPDPATLDDAQWASYVHDRDNIRGRHVERWWHVACCGLIFPLARDTLTHAITPADAGATP